MDLEPGFYWGEITFDRPAEGETVLAALRSVGFSEAYLEHRDPPPGYGVAARAAGIGVGGMFAESVKAANLSSNAIKASSAPSYTASVKAEAAPAPALKQQASVTTQPSVRAPDPIAQQAAASTQVSIKADATTATSNKGPTAPARGIIDDTPKAPAPKQAAPAPAPYDPYQFGTDDENQGGYGPAPQGYDAPAVQDFDGGGGGPSYGDEGGSAYDGGGYAPRAASRPMAPTVPSPGGGIVASASASPAVPAGCVPVGPGMFLCPPGSGIKVAGARSVWRVPFVARLDRPISLKDAPYARWTKAVRLPFDPFAPMSFMVYPWTLDEGVVYGMRILSRDRSVRSKNDVARILTSMGFDPVALLLAHRNMRVPRRGASCSEWIAFGRWTGPATIVTTDDPFYFAEARPYVDIEAEAS